MLAAIARHIEPSARESSLSNTTSATVPRRTPRQRTGRPIDARAETRNPFARPCALRLSLAGDVANGETEALEAVLQARALEPARLLGTRDDDHDRVRVERPQGVLGGLHRVRVAGLRLHVRLAADPLGAAPRHGFGLLARRVLLVRQPLERGETRRGGNHPHFDRRAAGLVHGALEEVVRDRGEGDDEELTNGHDP